MIQGAFLILGQIKIPHCLHSVRLIVKTGEGSIYAPPTIQDFSPIPVKEMPQLVHSYNGILRRNR